jgi:hypothetical protein
MRHVLEALIVVGLYTGSLCAHSVIYQSLAGTFTDTSENPALKTPFALTLTFGGNDGTITVKSAPGEHCVVTASITVPPSDDPLFSVTANGGTSATSTALNVEFTVHVLRNARQP